MDAHQTDSHDAFDALLDASSLGAPRVQAVRRHTPAAIRELLASRLARRTLPAPDAPGRRTPPPQRVTESAPEQPPLQRPGAQPDLVHAPRVGSRSHKFTHIRFDYRRSEKSIFIDSLNREKILQSVRIPMEYAVAPAWRDIYMSGILQSFVRGSEYSFPSPEERRKTRLFAEPCFSGEGSGCGLTGRYGMGLNIVSTSVSLSVKPWSFYNLSGQIFGNIEFMHAGSNSRVRADRQNSAGRTPLDLIAWVVGWPEAVVHDYLCWANIVERWQDFRVDVSGYLARGIGTQAGRSLARAMDRVLCTTTDHLTHLCSASWWLRTDHGTGGQAPLLSAFALSLWGNQRGRTPAGPGTAGWGGRYLWLDHFTVRPQRAPEDPHTARDGEEILCPPPAGPVSVRLSCLTAETYRSGVPAAMEERQGPNGTCAAFGLGQGLSERWSTRQYAAWGRMLAGDSSWSDYFMATPVYEMIMTIRAAEPLWNELSESSPENVPVPLPAALKLLRPAPAGSTAFSLHLNATLPYRIEATKKATVVRAAAEPALRAGGNPVSVVLTCRSDSPSIVHAVFEGLAEEQTGWNFTRDPLVEGTRGSLGSGGVHAGVRDEQLNDWVNLCACIRLNGTEDEVMLLMRKADLAQFLDSTRDISSNERHRMQAVLDTVSEELLNDARPR